MPNVQVINLPSSDFAGEFQKAFFGIKSELLKQELAKAGLAQAQLDQQTTQLNQQLLQHELLRRQTELPVIGEEDVARTEAARLKTEVSKAGREELPEAQRLARQKRVEETEVSKLAEEKAAYERGPAGPAGPAKAPTNLGEFMMQQRGQSQKKVFQEKMDAMTEGLKAQVRQTEALADKTRSDALINEQNQQLGALQDLTTLGMKGGPVKGTALAIRGLWPGMAPAVDAFEAELAAGKAADEAAEAARKLLPKSLRIAYAMAELKKLGVPLSEGSVEETLVEETTPGVAGMAPQVKKTKTTKTVSPSQEWMGIRKDLDELFGEEKPKVKEPTGKASAQAGGVAKRILGAVREGGVWEGKPLDEETKRKNIKELFADPGFSAAWDALSPQDRGALQTLWIPRKPEIPTSSALDRRLYDVIKRSGL